MKRRAIYPGTFDPVTYGHLNIIERSSLIFEKIILAVSDNLSKKTMFSLKKRVMFLKEEVKHLNNIEVFGFSDLIVNFAKRKNINILIRTIRSCLDFQYEYQLSNMNKYLLNTMETIFLFPSPKLSFISSSLIKEIIKNGGDVSSFLPKKIIEEIYKKIT